MKLVAVKLDVEASQMIQALDFVLEDVKKKGIQGKAVISMSMHVDGSEIVDKKFKYLVDSGVVVVVSAGNGNVGSVMSIPLVAADSNLSTQLTGRRRSVLSRKTS